MLTEREIREFAEVNKLLNILCLKKPKNFDYAVGVFYGELLIAVGFLAGDIIQGIGVKPEFQREGMAAKIVTHLIKKAVEAGKEQLYLFTKPEEVCRFQSVGFRKVVEAKPYAALLEWGRKGIDEYDHRLKKIAETKPDNAACVVVNCNPFTLGHRYLIEKAAGENAWVYVLVVEEDASLFPFDVRLELIKKGTSDLKNVTVIPGGKYVISFITFPSYFTRDEELADAQASLDLQIFVQHIAPALKITKRYVGQEPYCPITALYNRYMKDILSKKGIQVIEIERIENNLKTISASDVRQLIRENRIEDTKEFVPETTYQYLICAQAEEIMDRIRNKNSRH